MPPVSTDTITVVCPCGKKLKAPASAAGKKAKCPACGNVMKLEVSSSSASTAPPPAKASSSARASAPPPPPPPPAEDDGDGGVDLGDLYALAAVEKEARSSGAVDESPRCPKCFTELPAGAVLCTNCGFDLRARKQISVKTGDAKPGKPQGAGVLGYGKSGGGKKDKMAPQGSFFVGLGCCAGFAAVGAAIWFAIGYFTGFQFGFIAMGVGALAGVGMQIGQKGYSKVGGLVAAAMTLVAIVAANVALFAAVLHQDDSDDGKGQTSEEVALAKQEQAIEAEEAKYDERVLYELKRDQARKAGKPVPAEDSDEEVVDHSSWKAEVAARQAVVDRLKAMPKADYDEMIAKMDEKDMRQELISHLTEEELTKRNVSIHQSSYEDHFNDANRMAKTQVASMTRDQVKAQLGPRQEKAETERKKAAEDRLADMKAKGYDPSSGGTSAAVKTGVFLIVILLIFGWKSIFFVALGMYFAYKTAAGAVSG